MENNILACSEMNLENLNRMICLESAIYPEEYRQMQKCSSWEDVAKYCDCKLKNLLCVVESDWYFLAAVHKKHIEVVDVASSNKGMKCLSIVEKLKYYNKPVVFDAREKTSYRLIKSLVKYGKINVLRDKKYTWGAETFHEMKVEWREGCSLSEKMAG